MRVVLCNCAPSEADELARALVDERLAACVNLWPVRSVYRWQGAVQTDAEVTLLIKTADERVVALSNRIKQLHSYDTPEILVLPVDDRSDARYIDWVRTMTTGCVVHGLESADKP